MKKRQFMAAALLIVLGLIALDVYYLSPQTAAMKDTIETRYAALRRDEQYAAATVMPEDGVQALQKEVKGLEGRLIGEKTEFLAAALLQDEITRLGSSAGIRIVTLRPLAPVKAEPYSSIPLYFEGSGTIREVSRFLEAVERGTMLIRVEKLGLSVTNIQTPRELKFRMQVSGLVKL